MVEKDIPEVVRRDCTRNSRVPVRRSTRGTNASRSNSPLRRLIPRNLQLFLYIKPCSRTSTSHLRPNWVRSNSITRFRRTCSPWSCRSKIWRSLRDFFTNNNSRIAICSKKWSTIPSSWWSRPTTPTISRRWITRQDVRRLEESSSSSHLRISRPYARAT